MTRSEKSAKLEMRILRFMQLPFVVALVINMVMLVRVPLQEIRADALPAAGPPECADPSDESVPQEVTPASDPHEVNPPEDIRSSDQSRESREEDRVAESGAKSSSARERESGLLLICPATNGSDIHFVVNNEDRVLRPGQSERLLGRDLWTIQFHRGGEFGDAKYVLAAGSYKFTAGPRGWDLMKSTTNKSAP